MKEVMLNHPYKDTQIGGILIPTEVRIAHAGPIVLYESLENNLVGIMSLDTWKTYCSPVIFEAREGA